MKAYLLALFVTLRLKKDSAVSITSKLYPPYINITSGHYTIEEGEIEKMS